MKKSAILPVSFGGRIVIRPERSIILVSTIAGTHITALLAAMVKGLPVLLVLALLILLAISLVAATSSLGLHMRSLSIRSGGEMHLQMRRHQWVKVVVLESFLCRWLVVVRIKVVASEKIHLLVYPRDSMDPASFRRMKAFVSGLRCHPLEKA